MVSSSRPYLIRALYEWIVDNGWVPHILVDARAKNLQVPEQYVGSDGRIVLNISPDATRGLLIGNDRIVFTTRFSGVSYQVCVPPFAVKAIYAKENGEGMAFPEEEEEEHSTNTISTGAGGKVGLSGVDNPNPDLPPPPPPKTARRKPQLKVVK